MTSLRPIAAALLTLCVGSAAWADVHLSVRPVFGEGCLARTSPTELIATVDNPLAVPLVGTLVLEHGMGAANRTRTLHAVQVSIGPRAHADVHITTADIVPGNDLVAVLHDARGNTVASETLGAARSADTMLVDATQGARYALAMRAAAPPEALAPGGAQTPAGLIGCPVARDSASGDPVLPWSAQGYAQVSLVLIDTSTLTAMGARERITLADYILRGGTLAVVVDQPEDLRHPVLTALVGSDITVGPLARPVNEAPALNPWYRPSGGNAVHTLPGAETLAHAVAYTGGNLHNRSLVTVFPSGAPNALGSSAEYGHGQVHLLSFIPSRAPALDDPWTVAVMQQLATHAAELPRRRLLTAARDSASIPSPVRALLSAPDTRRTGLGRALGMLFFYALALPIAMLVTRSLTRRRYGLAAVPCLAIAAFVTVALLGMRGRKNLAHARSVALIDLAAGFPRGAIRRFHGYTPHANGALLARFDGSDRAVIVDPDAGRTAVRAVEAPAGTSLLGLNVRAWSPLIVREEGTETLSGNISLVTDAALGLRVINHLHEPLEDVVLLGSESESGWYFRWIPPGSQRRAEWGTPLSDDVVRALRQNDLSQGLPLWGSEAARRMAAEVASNTRPAHGPSDPTDIIPRALHLDALRTESWRAAQGIAEMAAEHNWQVATEPVLIARIVRTARADDNGMALDRDDTWVRVRGFGGAP